MRADAIARSPRVTAADAEVRRALRRARARGLRALLFPILTVREIRMGEWRGALRPRDVDAWWRSYERFILHYAELGAAEAAAALVVGSELGFSETWRDRWYHLISRVERVYSGDLVYSANWDHYRAISFLSRLDHLGISAYFELTDDGDASEAELTRAWRRAAAELRAFARAERVSLWLTEVGYPSRDRAAIRPWDYSAARPDRPRGAAALLRRPDRRVERRRRAARPVRVELVGRGRAARRRLHAARQAGREAPARLVRRPLRRQRVVTAR